MDIESEVLLRWCILPNLKNHELWQDHRSNPVSRLSDIGPNVNVSEATWKFANGFHFHMSGSHHLHQSDFHGTFLSDTT